MALEGPEGPEGPRALSAGSIQPGESVDRSASGLQYQRYNMSLTATGAQLGQGRRSVPPADAQFRNPPVSNAQFGEGSNARESMEEI